MERFEQAPPAPENPTPVEAMAHRLRTPDGRKVYALRKQTPEPVFGIIKAALGFRQFSLRGLDKVRGEWSLVTMAWNMKRMFALSPALRGRARPGDEKADSCWSIGEITTRSGRHQTSGGSWQRQNRPRRSATKPQSD